MAVNDDIADQVTEHAINLLRLEAGARRKARAHFKQLERELVEVLARIDPGSPQVDTYRMRRVQKLLNQVRNTIKASYSSYGQALSSDLRGVSRLEATAVADELNGVLRAEVASVGLPASTVRSIVTNTLIEGDVLSGWLSRQSAAFQQRLQTEMNIGALAGESVPQLTQRIRGTRVPSAPRGTYTGGIMNTTTREAEALARTSIQQIANTSRMEAYKQNADIIKGVQALVTLDLRTSEICISRSGGAWDLKTGQPLPQSTVKFAFPGPPPWHWNCRTTLIPITKSWDELGARTQNKLPEGTQASMDGQVAGDLTYEQWLRKQTTARQREVLGPTKYKLWKAGKITSLRQLVDQTGRPLSVSQLKRRYGGRRTAA